MNLLDRDAARLVLQEWFGMNGKDKHVLDALEGCVRPAPAPSHEFTPLGGHSNFCGICGVPDMRHVTPVPAQTIDRDTLVDMIDSWDAHVTRHAAGLRADAVLALLRPVDGVILTREEAATAYDIAQAFRGIQGGRLSDTSFELRVRSLAARLESAS